MPRRDPLIYLIQGPRPWWAAPLLVLIALVTMLLIAPSLPNPWTMTVVWSALATFLVANLWMFARWAEHEAYKHIATQDRFDRCPVCRYSFEGLTVNESDPTRCPECGEHLATLRRHAEIIAHNAAIEKPAIRSD